MDLAGLKLCIVSAVTEAAGSEAAELLHLDRLLVANVLQLFSVLRNKFLPRRQMAQESKRRKGPPRPLVRELHMAATA
jgi:hypothetical protein